MAGIVSSIEVVGALLLPVLVALVAAGALATGGLLLIIYWRWSGP